MPVPELRVRQHNQAPERGDGDFVLYWMIGARRASHNFALDHAVDTALRLGKPLVVLEPLRVDYRWASHRHHTFIVQGMQDNARAFAGSAVRYHPFVERAAGDGRGLLQALASRACAVITDHVPGFFLPRMVQAAARQLDVRLQSVDGTGLYPLSATERVFPSAYVFRRHLQKELAPHLFQAPRAQPLRRLRGQPCALPPEVLSRWPASDVRDVAGLLLGLPIDATVAAAPLRGGAEAAHARLEDFVAHKLQRYQEERSDPDADMQSGLSPYLHHGHIGAHQVFAAVVKQQRWDPSRTGGVKNGSKQGFWGMDENAEGFLDELVTWRELGLHMAHKDPAFEQWSSLPAWARATLERHAADPRPHLYGLDALRDARTHDELWNAAQRQLLRDGTIHNYLRMLWGKKVLEWSSSPQQALAHLIELNNRFALDGRDANSMSGIFWCFGRYDRAWGPERSIFGTVRYMSSDNTRRKLDVKRYLARYAAQPTLF